MPASATQLTAAAKTYTYAYHWTWGIGVAAMVPTPVTITYVLLQLLQSHFTFFYSMLWNTGAPGQASNCYFFYSAQTADGCLSSILLFQHPALTYVDNLFLSH